MESFDVEGGRSFRGRVRVPGDKSISHRALLLAALARGPSRIRGLADGEDVAATRRAIVAMGATVNGEEIIGGDLHEPDCVIDVGNSGTALRLLAGWCAPGPWFVVLSGDASVRSRPMGRVVKPLRQMGARIDGRHGGAQAPLVVRGGALVGIDHRLEVASAQVKGAVLFAALGAYGPTTVYEETPVREHTEELLIRAGVKVEIEDGPDGTRRVRVEPGDVSAFDLDVPGDPSSAAYWLVGACLAPDSDVVVEDVYLGRARLGFLDVLTRMGADIEVAETGDKVGAIRARTSALEGTTIEAHEVPGLVDEIPLLALAGAVATGTTSIEGASELRVKESDRIESTANMLRAMGADVSTRPDGLVVNGGGPGSLKVSRFIDSSGDHRIAMSAAVAASVASAGTTVIGDWESVATSYPGFDQDLARCVS